MTQQSVSSFIDYEAIYFDMSQRLSKGVQAFYQSYYYTVFNDSTGQIVRTRNPYRFIGGNLFAAYPLNRYYRLEGSVGLLSRKYDAYPFWVNSDAGSGIVSLPTQNSFPSFGTKLVGDTVEYQSFGPISGRALSIGLNYAPFTGGTELPGSSGPTLTFDITADLRHYFKITRRSLLAARLYGFRATGNLPDVLSFGGLDTLRVMPYYSIIGNSAAFMNLEFRFPLIDFLATPILGIEEIRGKGFIDIGGAALKGQPWQFWSDYTLCGGGNVPGCNGSSGGLSDYGFGLSLNFLGLPLHFEFARQWNFKQPLPAAQCAKLGLDTNCGNFKFIFYIGPDF